MYSIHLYIYNANKHTRNVESKNIPFKGRAREILGLGIPHIPEIAKPLLHKSTATNIYKSTL